MMDGCSFYPQGFHVKTPLFPPPACRKSPFNSFPSRVLPSLLEDMMLHQLPPGKFAAQLNMGAFPDVASVACGAKVMLGPSL